MFQKTVGSFESNSEMFKNVHGPVVVILPHQDDEMFLAGAIAQFVFSGRDVYVVVVTDGGSSRVRHVLNGVDDAGGTVFCEYHKRIHNPEEEGYVFLTRQDFVSARNTEVSESMMRLGVPASHVIFMNPGGVSGSAHSTYRDGVLTADQAREVIDELYAQFGSGIYLALADGHGDHIVLERGLEETAMTSSAKIFFPLEKKNAESRAQLSKREQDAKQHALGVYYVWNPVEDRFAIGAHSVVELLKDWSESTQEYFTQK